MHITALQTLRLPDQPNLVWVEVETDAGITGLGETFRGAAAVETYLHTMTAPLVLGKNPLAIERLHKTLLRGYLGFNGSGVETRAASAIDIALWDLFGKLTGQPVYQLLGGACHERMRTYNTCAGSDYNSRSIQRRLIEPGKAQVRGRYDDQVAFIESPAELAQSLLDEGFGAMKIWPFDGAATQTDGQFASAALLRQSLEVFEKIRLAVGDRIAPARQKPIVGRAVAAGVHVLVANGNTSEYYALRAGEAEAMVAASAEHVAGRVPLLAGIGRGVEEACDLAAASYRAGADALMIHQLPDPFVAPRGVVAYVERIAAAGQGLPLVLYLRNENIGQATIAALCAIPEVVGVKWASPTPLLLSDAIRRGRARNLAWVCGLAEHWAPALYAAGARGFTSGQINVRPDLSMGIHAALARGDYAGAQALIEDILPFETLRAQENNGTNVTVVKAALQRMGLDCGPTRPPSAWPMTDEAAATLDRLMADWPRA